MPVTSVIWTIKDFGKCPAIRNSYLSSPIFSYGYYSFSLSLYPCGDERSSEIVVTLNRAEDFGRQKVSVQYDLSIIYPENSHKVNHISCLEKNHRHRWRLISQLQFGHGSVLSFDLTIRCDLLSLSFIGWDTYGHGNDSHADLLSNHFAKALESGENSDIVLSVEGKRFNAHRVVLKCRCPKLFETLAETDVPNEYSLNVIKASDLKVILDYLYTGKFDVANMSEELSDAIDKFHIFDLKHSLLYPYDKTVKMKTEISVSKISFQWPISGFKQLQHGEVLTHPIFSDLRKESKVDMSLIAVTSGYDNIGVRLKFKRLTRFESVFISCKVTITGWKTEIQEHLLGGEDWVTELTFRKDGNFQNLNELQMLFDISTSTLDFVSNIESKVTNSSQENVRGNIVKNLKELQEDFSSLCNDGGTELPDVTLSVEGMKRHAHKVFLCARSPVFAKMFENNFLEKKESLVTIEDVASTTFSLLLQYIYSGRIAERNVTHIINLYVVADRYEIMPLKEECADFLKNAVDATHVGKMLVLADLYNDESLKTCVVDYIVRNSKAVVECKTALDELKSHVDVYTKVLEAVLERFHKQQIQQIHQNKAIPFKEFEQEKQQSQTISLFGQQILSQAFVFDGQEKFPIQFPNRSLTKQ